MRDEDNETIGFIGIGRMGEPIVMRLLDAGFDVLVWNRTPERCEQVVRHGAEQLDSIAEIVDGADLLVLCLADTRAVEEVVFGESGIAASGEEDQLLIDLSRTDPVATQRFARELDQICGIAWIDAPVSGDAVEAEDGGLPVLAGGHEEDIARAAAVFEAFAARVDRVGDVGAGQFAALCGRMLAGCTALAVGEMIALAERCGIDAERLPDALAGTAADSVSLRLVGPRMAVRQYEPVVDAVGSLQRDLDAVLEVARAADSAVPMSALAAQLLRQHRIYTDGAADCATLIELFAAE